MVVFLYQYKLPGNEGFWRFLGGDLCILKYSLLKLFGYFSYLSWVPIEVRTILIVLFKLEFKHSKEVSRITLESKIETLQIAISNPIKTMWICDLPDVIAI